MSDQAVTINGEAQTIPSGTTIAGLLGLLEMGERRVAVAVNRDVVPRTRHAGVELLPGDEVEILEAVGGG
jgi:sulfur carrier protein